MKKILLPIRPEFVARIFSGDKKVEYRKKVVSDVEHILIYATVPVQKVVAEFKVEKILCASPYELWMKTKSVGGINETDFFNYFRGCEKAYAYVISCLKIYENPYLLSDLGIKRAPQNYQYIR